MTDYVNGGGEDMVVNVKVMNYAHSKYSLPAPTSK